MSTLEKIPDEQEQKELLKKAIGLLKVFGPDTPEPAINYLREALSEGICTREEIDGAWKNYSENYTNARLRRLFS